MNLIPTFENIFHTHQQQKWAILGLVQLLLSFAMFMNIIQDQRNMEGCRVKYIPQAPLDFGGITVMCILVFSKILKKPSIVQK